MVVGEPRGDVVFLSESEQAAKAERFLEKRKNRVERLLPVCDRKGYLWRETGPDVIMGAQTKRIEAQRLLPFANRAGPLALSAGFVVAPSDTSLRCGSRLNRTPTPAAHTISGIVKVEHQTGHRLAVHHLKLQKAKACERASGSSCPPTVLPKGRTIPHPRLGSWTCHRSGDRR
jgi:hypothetical protein